MSKNNKPHPDGPVVPVYTSAWIKDGPVKTELRGYRRDRKDGLEALLIRAAREHSGGHEGSIYVTISRKWPLHGLGQPVVDPATVLTSRGNPAEVVAMARIKLNPEFMFLKLPG